MILYTVVTAFIRQIISVFDMVMIIDSLVNANTFLCVTIHSFVDG